MKPQKNLDFTLESDDFAMTLAYMVRRQLEEIDYDIEEKLLACCGEEDIYTDIVEIQQQVRALKTRLTRL